MVPYTTTDSKGHSTTHMRAETRYHSCPYLKVEHEYTVSTTLGDFEIGGRFAEPNRAAWRTGHNAPSYVETGPPGAWLAAKKRLASGKPGGVTKLHDYKNFLLASDATLLKDYSADIESYQSKKLLPPHTTNFSSPIYDYYMADKFQAVRLKTDITAWNEALLRFNGYLGAQLQGDAHIAAVNADIVGDRDRYSQALFAYWKGPEFKKDAFPKNAIGVVLGVKDGKVAWARATGGLPTGNEPLFNDIRNELVGVEFTPEAILGNPASQKGKLASVVWGKNKFKRPCMECAQEKTDGFEYLRADIGITGGERFWIVSSGLIVSACVWVVFLLVDTRRRY